MKFNPPKNSCFLIFFIAFLAACNQEMTDESKQVEKVLQQLIQSDNQGDLNGVLSHYAENAVLMSPNSASIIGSDNIEAHYDQLFQNFSFAGLEAISKETKVQGNLATISGINYGKMISKEDTTTIDIHGKFVMLFEKQQGRWKISRLIWNDAGSMDNLSIQTKN